MKKIWTCRRTFVAVLAIIVLAGLGFTQELDVAFSLVSIVGLIGACNAAENVFSNKKIAVEEK